jgi:hypothetical protein
MLLMYQAVTGSCSPDEQVPFNHAGCSVSFNIKKENLVNYSGKLILALTLAVASVAAPLAQAAEVPMVTGEQWTRSSEDVQKAYLIGVANLTQIENAYSQGNPPSDTQSFVPRLVKGLQGQTLDSVREGLNRWYAANPGKLQRPVIETIWFEMAVPGLQKNK